MVCTGAAHDVTTRARRAQEWAIRKERAHHVTTGARIAQEWAIRKERAHYICNHRRLKVSIVGEMATSPLLSRVPKGGQWLQNPYRLGAPQRSMRGMKSEMGSKGTKRLNMFVAYLKSPEIYVPFE